MTRMSRRQLYDLVWSKPMRDAARELGISDVGLKKVCVRHQVPVPPQGYWNKVHAGQKPRKLAYQEVDDGSLDQIVVEGSYDRLPSQARQLVRERTTDKDAREATIDVDIHRPSSEPNAVVLATALRAAKPNDKGLLEALGPKLLHVQVSPQSVDRTVAIVDALLLAATARGMVAKPGAEHLKLVVDGEAIELHLHEEVRWVTRPLTDQEAAREERRRREAKAQHGEFFELIYQPEPLPGTYQAQGRLTIEVVKKEYGVPGRWRDTATRKLEALLNRLLGDLVILAATAKARREESERRERQWQLAEERRQREEARESLLEEQLKSFATLELMERYLGSLSRSVGQSDMPRSVQAYVAWCRRYADGLRAICSANGVKQALSE